MDDATDCRGCGGEIPPKRYQGGPPKVWCSMACKAKWKRDNDPGYAESERIRKAAIVERERPRKKAARRWREAQRKLNRAARGTRGRRPMYSGFCLRCGEAFTSWHTNVRFCSLSCRKVVERRRYGADAKQRRRASRRDAFVATVYRRQIFERDRWTCQLCGRHLVREAKVPAPLAPTIDHVIPLARGGTHEPANVQAAHFICNARKGDRAANDQLRLVG